MLTAAEARRLSDKRNDETITGQLVKIESLISEAVQKGQTQISFYDSMRKEVKEKLESLGYFVSDPQVSGPNEYDIDIKW